MIPVNQPLLDGNEEKYVVEALRDGWISSEGPAVKRFEDLFAARLSRKHAIAVCNGTAALEAAVLALELPSGSEVILPSFTIISCAAAVVRAGLTPVVVDSEPATWNMDVATIRGAITARTRAIMPVHIYGLPVNMEPVWAIAREYNLAVIEDAAEAIGQDYKSKPCGSLGDISCFSFYPNKHVTTGEGGMILTDDDSLAERCRSLRNLCFKAGRRFVHDTLGFNYRMTNLQAALGIAQLERLDQFVIRKRQIGQLYDSLLADVASVERPVPRTDYAENVYWVYGLVIRDEHSLDAEAAMKLLAAEGIGTRPFFWPMHEQPVLKKMGFFANTLCPVAERLARRGFYLPSGLALTDGQIHSVAKTIRKVLS
jgi:perosamine synthetase